MQSSHVLKLSFKIKEIDNRLSEGILFELSLEDFKGLGINDDDVEELIVDIEDNDMRNNRFYQNSNYAITNKFGTSSCNVSSTCYYCRCNLDEISYFQIPIMKKVKRVSLDYINIFKVIHYVCSWGCMHMQVIETKLYPKGTLNLVREMFQMTYGNMNLPLLSSFTLLDINGGYLTQEQYHSENKYSFIELDSYITIPIRKVFIEIESP